MKKIISILLALVLLFSFAACSADKEPEASTPAASDASSTSDKSSEENTDEQDNKDNTEKDTTKKADSTGSTARAAEKTTAKKDKETTKKPSTTKEETTVKREIKLNIIYPYYNSTTTKVNIEYKGSKDKEYTSIFEKKEKGKTIIDKPEITLNDRKTVSYDIDKKIAGDVDIRITLDDVELLENNFKISGRDSEITIELVSGTEMLVDDF